MWEKQLPGIHSKDPVTYHSGCWLLHRSVLGRLNLNVCVCVLKRWRGVEGTRQSVEMCLLLSSCLPSTKLFSVSCKRGLVSTPAQLGEIYLSGGWQG